MKLFSRRSPTVPRRGVHLDLKGNQPTPRRLLELLDLFAAVKLDVVLAEWEDTFPWKCYPELRSRTAYTPETIARFHARASELGIEVIPLVQCFGHAENVLSRSRFRSLREAPNDVSEFCASKLGSARLVIEMADDVLEQTGRWIDRFHLGGDEAWHMGSCPRCKRTVGAKGKDSLYLSHVGPILDHLNLRGVRPILWDDMMRKWPDGALREIGRKSDLMAWCYGAEPVGRGKEWLNEGHLKRYRKAGVTAWGASAYKGGDGAFADVPDPETRNKNNLGWAKQAGKHRLAGIVATAWSRYNTFMSPCETIEASLHTLVTAAAAMWDGKLPKDATGAAESFLKRWKGGREYRIYKACHGAATALAGWQKDGTWSVNEMSRAAHLNGEPARINPAVQKRYAGWARNELAKGHKLADAFIRAHRGHIPEVWLKLYASSRLMPVERRLRNILSGSRR
jgi:hypothetical protein